MTDTECKEITIMTSDGEPLNYLEKHSEHPKVG